ncbi:MAG: ERF family protein [Fusobacteriaceae bacterium]
MGQKTPPINLYKKLLEIQKKILGLKKDKKSDNYDYVTGNKVLSYLKPLMNEHGVLLKQEVIRVDKERIDYKTKNGEKSEMLYLCEMRFTWIDSETGEEDANYFYASGQNSWEKGMGSALTYGERYFLLKYFHIPTDEDDIDNPDRKPEDNKPLKETKIDKDIVNTKQEAAITMIQKLIGEDFDLIKYNGELMKERNLSGYSLGTDTQLKEIYNKIQAKKKEKENGDGN